MALNTFSSGVNTSFSSQLNNNFDFSTRMKSSLWNITTSTVYGSTYSNMASLSLASSSQCVKLRMSVRFSHDGDGSTSSTSTFKGIVVTSTGTSTDIFEESFPATAGEAYGTYNYIYDAPSSQYITRVVFQGKNSQNNINAKCGIIGNPFDESSSIFTAISGLGSYFEYHYRV